MEGGGGGGEGKAILKTIVRKSFWSNSSECLYSILLVRNFPLLILDW